jgi:hypothetical protein
MDSPKIEHPRRVLALPQAKSREGFPIGKLQINILSLQL